MGTRLAFEEQTQLPEKGMTQRISGTIFPSTSLNICRIRPIITLQRFVLVSFVSFQLPKDAKDDGNT